MAVHDGKMPGLKEAIPVFHAGEVALQETMGVAERLAETGARVIRDFMPDQHRAFFAQLPFALIGSVDPDGDAWATAVSGKPGFIASPDPQLLTVAGGRDPLDPADRGLEDGDGIGLLGIELHTRRRNRVNGILRRRQETGFEIEVEHSFGNCPKYIQLRDYRFADPGPVSPPLWLDRLDDRARAMIAGADTFFVATYVDREDGSRQTDVSHRGGKPGFVRIDAGGDLVVPDFPGNRFFNTLGNILANGKAGLAFIDFSAGGMLQLSGDAEIVVGEGLGDVFEGSERFWRFKPRRIVYRSGAVALRWRDREDSLSPFLSMTGAWT